MAKRFNEYYLNWEEINRIIASAKNIKESVVLKILARTGMRRFELAGLKAKDVDFERRRIFIAKGKGGNAENPKSRSVPIDEDTLQTIRFYLNGRKAGYLIESNKRGSEGLSLSQVNRIVSNCARRANVSNPNPRLQHINPHIFRHSFSRLSLAAGIPFEFGLLEEEARELNIGFVSRMTRGRPWVRMKIAATLDGRTALSDGVSQWITGEEARKDGHRWRARACAILTGAGTVRADDPQLTVREVETPRQPLRVIADSHLETPADARILQGEKVLIFAARDGKAPPRTEGRVTGTVGFNTRTETFMGITDIPSGGGVRHMHFYAPTRTVWFGTDSGTIGKIQVPVTTPLTN